MFVTSVHVDANPTASSQNCKELVHNMSEVHDVNNNSLVYGLYQKLLKQEQDVIEKMFSAFTQWSAKCYHHGSSVGKYFSIAPGGRGSLAITEKVLGPFR